MSNDSFDKIKSEIIAHLKKLEQEENSNELKKAVAYFSNSESMFSYLEKSAEGKWIEKAGYGVGTVRIWKGKKYKKISTSPVRWVRVFDKMDRGAKNAMTRLVHQAEKIDNPEEMLKFVLANKQRFVDENGKPLDFVDRLNAVIDSKNFEKENPDYPFKPKTEKERAERTTFEKDRDDFIERMDKIRQDEQKKDVSKMSKDEILSEMAKQVKLKNNKDENYYEKLKNGLDKINKISDKAKKDAGDKINVNDFTLNKLGKKIDGEYPKFNKEQQKKLFSRIIEEFGESEKARKLIQNMQDFNSQKGESLDINSYGDSWDYMKKQVGKELVDANRTDKKVAQSYWIQDSKGNRINNNDAMQKIRNNLDEIDKLYGSDTPRKDMKIRDLENYNEDIISKLIPEERKEMESEQEKHKNRSDAMEDNDNAKKDNAKPTITFDRNGRLGEKAVNTKLGTDNIKALDALPEKFADERLILKYPSEVEIDGEKKFAYTNGQFLVVTHDIPANGVKTKQSEKIEGNYPNVSRVIPKEFKDNSAPKVDIDIDQVMKDLPKVYFSKKAFNDDSHKQFMKIGDFWYDAKMVKATYDMLKGDNAEVLESKDTYSNGRFGRICIKTDKGYSVIVSLSNDYAENYKKQSIYNSDEGSMSANAKAEYESRKKTGLPDTYINNAVEFGYQIDNKGFIHGEDKNITFKGKGENTEFYYNGIPTGIKNRSSYMYGTKENIQTRIDAVKKQIENNIESYKEGKKNPANKPANYDATFPNMTDKDLTDIYKWWSNPKNIEEAIYKNSYKTKVPGLGSYGNDARKIGVVEDRVMDMLPDIKKEIARRGITIKKSLDGELIFESSLESYVKKSISIMKKSLIG